MLCATLCWLKTEREKDSSWSSKILYCSRTHSQLSQVIHELRNTAYKPKVIILGSRDQMCVNTQVNHHSGASLNSKWKSLRSGKKSNQYWEFYKNSSSKKNPQKIGWDAFDIEDLHKIGTELKLCPYYLQKSRISEADLILMPYNYLLDQRVRTQFGINFEKSIMIFDEAHNIEKVCEDISSFEISVSILNDSIRELSTLHKKAVIGKDVNQCLTSIEEINEIKQITKSFRNYLKSFDVHSEKDYRGYIIDLMLIL